MQQIARRQVWLEPRRQRPLLPTIPNLGTYLGNRRRTLGDSVSVDSESEFLANLDRHLTPQDKKAMEYWNSQVEAKGEEAIMKAAEICVGAYFHDSTKAHLHLEATGRNSYTKQVPDLA